MKKKILIVEDDSPIRETIMEILEGQGYSVTTAPNGQRGIEQLSQDANFNLILLDLMMPIMDGFAFRAHQLLNPTWSSIPVLVLSADGHGEKRLKKIGNIDYLKKPIDIDDLINAVATHCS